MGDNDAIGEGAGEYFSEYFKDELAAGEVGLLEFKGDSSTVPMQRSTASGRQLTATLRKSRNFLLTGASRKPWSRWRLLKHKERGRNRIRSGNLYT